MRRRFLSGAFANYDRNEMRWPRYLNVPPQLPNVYFQLAALQLLAWADEAGASA